MPEGTYRLRNDVLLENLDGYGEQGRLWLEKLPNVVAECARKWSLELGAPYQPLYSSYVVPATRADGTPVVLKLPVLHRELLLESEALRLYDGRGAVRLLEVDPERGALLMERIEPGTTLTRLAEEDDEAATEAAAALMLRLRRPVPPDHLFPLVEEWAGGLRDLRRRFGGATGPLPARLVRHAEALFAELLPSMDAPVLLHGDLHHANILAAQREPWLAVDPKGVVGEPAYEVGALLRNPHPQLLSRPRPDRVLARRLDQLVEMLGFDRGRMRDWAVAQAVLAAWWDLEDKGQGWEQWVACAELLARLES